MSTIPAMRSHALTRTALLWLSFVVLLTACTKKEPQSEATEEEVEAPADKAPAELDLWAGVPPLVPEDDDLAEVIEPRPRPDMPPSVGERVELPFPPEVEVAGGPPKVAPKELKVERYGPRDTGVLSDTVRLSFNQPMVPLAAVEALEAKTPPVTIDPAPPGKVRWLGTRTLVFQAEGRLPFSTTYEVTVPTSAKSTAGQSLAKPFSWKFSTPTLALASATPYDGASHVDLEPQIVLEFNQPIARVPVLAGLTMKGGGKTIGLTEVGPKAGEEQPEWKEKRIVRLKADTKLAPNTRYAISLPPGVYGEGPNASGAISASFNTYPPLRLSKEPCYGTCWATSGIRLSATNQLADPDVASKVTVDPAVPGMSVSSYWSGIQLSGDFEGGRKYEVRVAASLRDGFGQTLGKDFVTSVTLGPPYPTVRPLVTRSPAVIERAGKHELKLRIGGIKSLELEARSLAPKDLPSFLDVYSYGSEFEWPAGVAASTYTKKLSVKSSLKKMEDRAIDLDAILTGGQGTAWLLARSEQLEDAGWKYRVGHTQLVEVTDLGIASALDRDDGTILVTRLSDGLPVKGAEVKVLARYGGAELWSGTTDADGLAAPTFARSSELGLVVAKTADDFAFLRVDATDLTGTYRYGRASDDRPAAFFFTERTPYKPGDTIHLVGILRKHEPGPSGGVAMWRKGVKANYVVNDPRGNEVAKGDVEIGPFGTVAVDIETDEDGVTGNYSFNLTSPGFILGSTQNFYHSIPVETYRTPEFTVEVERPESKPLVYGETLDARIKGEYLHGAPLVGGETQWTLSRATSGFTPPGDANRDFTFGTGPSWGSRSWGFSTWSPVSPSPTIKSGSGQLDALGQLSVSHVVQVDEPDPTGSAPPKPKVKKGFEPPVAATTYTLAATVTDDNRQAIAGSASFVVHPARVYLGLRSEKNVLREGGTAELSSIVVDLDGERVEGRSVALEVFRQVTERKAVEKDGRWTFEYDTKRTPAGDCAGASAATPTPCSITLGDSGTYVVRGKTTDADGRKAESELTFFVHGKDAIVWGEDEHRIDLVPDRQEYRPGDTATVLLQSPFEEARGVVVIEREGSIKQVPVHLTGGSHVIEVPIDEGMTPRVSVSAVLARGRVEIPGAPKGEDLGRPAAASGRVFLDVSDEKKRIEVEIEPGAERIAPGEKVTVKLRTTAHGNEPTRAAVALMVVDEGVLSLLGHQTPDPVSFFHRARSPEVWLHALQAAVMAQEEPPPPPPETTAAPGGVEGAYGTGGLGLGGGGRGVGTIGLGAADDSAAPTAAAPMEEQAEAKKDSRPRKKSKAGKGAPRPPASPSPLSRRAEAAGERFDTAAAMAQPVSLRDVFATTAYFNAEVMTDASGLAEVEIEMPENLTTFRIMAVAVDPDRPDRFGNGEAKVTVRKPIMVRPSLPRFANYGDSFEASVMVDNQSDEEQTILTGTRGLNVQLTGAAETFVTIPAGESREVRFDMKTQEVGDLRLQFAVMSNAGRDATELSIPVHYPATTRAFADYGMTDGTITRALEPPTDALPDFGGLEISMSSTALSGLEDAVEYLVTYPYECAEQTASRILPIFALGEIIEEFPIASVADKARRDALAAEGIERLVRKQNYDGGFGYWKKGESWPYLTNWVVLALSEGKRRGYKVDETVLANALRYVENFVRYGHRSRWGLYYDWTSRAFGLWLLAQEGKGSDLFATVYAHRDDLPLYAKAHLMGAAHEYGKTAEVAELRKAIDAAVVESPRAIHFAESASEADAEGLSLLMHSNVQTDAIILMALLDTAPKDTMLPKVMTGIMASRDVKRGGRWLTTHANAWALLAASRYYETVEGEEPDFMARIWLDDAFAGEQKFAGRSMTTIDQRVPMRTVAGKSSLTLHKDGPGKLYYRVGLKYAPADLKLEAMDQGFLVYREYEALPEPGETEPDPKAVQRTEEGWQVEAGTNVKVTLHVVARDRANYVVIDDALPAGFEGQNPRFVTSVAATSSSTRTATPGRWWWPWWTFDHTDLRDDRMLLFADRMPAGVYTYSYTARATTIGTFHLPPVKAEAMYEPERFGHSSSGTVRVVETP